MDGGGGSAQRGSSAARAAAARTQTAHMRVESSGATDSHGPPGTRSATRHVGVSSASSARGGSALRARAVRHARERLGAEIAAEIAAVVDGVSQLRLGVAELREQFGARARPLRPIRAFSLQLFAEVINMRLECGVVVLRRRRAGAATP